MGEEIKILLSWASGTLFGPSSIGDPAGQCPHRIRSHPPTLFMLSFQGH